MIVMLSALGAQPVLRPMITPPCRSREPCDAALLSPATPPLLSPAMRRALACWHGPERRDTPTGQAHHDISPVDNVAPRVDDLTARSFFLTHPVDGITAGNESAVGQSFGLVLSTIPSPRTGRAACLHRLSTDLCTARLDAGSWPQKTVRTGR